MTGDFLESLVEVNDVAFQSSLDNFEIYAPHLDLINKLLGLNDAERAEKQRELSHSGDQVLITISRLDKSQLIQLVERFEA